MKTLKLQSQLALELISGEFYKRNRLSQMEIMRETALFNGYTLEWLADNSDEFIRMFVVATNNFLKEAVKIAENLKPAK